MTNGTRLAVLVGGALGTLLRSGFGELARGAEAWPWGTFTANLLGASLLGLAAGWLDGRGPDPRWVPVTGGFLGAATTFSTFVVEAGAMAADRPMVALAYVLASVAAGLALVTAGRRVGQDLAVRGRVMP